MRANIVKVVNIALACALVFMVAAPLIVGVYDAANPNEVSAPNAPAGAKGSIQVYTGRSGDDLSISDVSTLQSVGNGLLERPENTADNEESRPTGSDVYSGLSSGNSVIGEKVLRENSSSGNASDSLEFPENSSTYLSDWYSGRSYISNLFASGDAHLIYSFADGSTVDFGNPYILDWTDVLPPDDFDDVLALANDDSSIFAPEKAYAGPISWVAKKLQYLLLKTGWGTSVVNAFWAMMVTGATAMGMYAPEINQFLTTYQTEITAATEYVSKEGFIVSEEDMAMVLSDGIWTLSQRGQSLAEIPAILEEEMVSITTTGELLGGGSSNFMNALYDIISTNELTAQFVMDNADFFTTFFGWLGAELTEYDDVPGNESLQGQTVSFSDLNINLVMCSRSDLGLSPFGRQPYIGFYYKDAFYCLSSNTYSASQMSDLNENFVIGDVNGGDILYIGNISSGDSHGHWAVGSGTSIYRQEGSNLVKIKDDDPLIVDGLASRTDGLVKAAHIDTVYLLNEIYSWRIVYVADNKFWQVANWQAATGLVASVPDATVSELGDTQIFDGTILGADAQYDDASNITDYGNVTVPNVFAPDYVAPGSWAEALAQMNATATTENPAHAESPAFGQTEGTTVKDWTDANKPSDPAPSEGRDAFKIEDLEKVFPFCIPWDLYYLLAALAAEPEAPNFVWTFDFGDLGKHELPIDLAPFEPVAEVVRIGETLLFCVGLAFVTRDLIRG